MTQPATKRDVVRHYNGLPPSIQWYFTHLPKLAEEFPWEVSLAYQFSRVELAHNMAIYCGVTKLHRAHPELSWTAVQKWRMTREGFRALFETVYGQAIPRNVAVLIANAEKVRDNIMHGKHVRDPIKRVAVCEVLDYASGLNDFTNQVAGIRPFGDLRGYKGRAACLDKSTSKWLLKGLGLGLS